VKLVEDVKHRPEGI